MLNTGYFECQNKETDVTFCQFGYPKQLYDHSEFAKEANCDFADFHSRLVVFVSPVL